MAEKSLDVTLYGATGFTGQQAAHYFAAHAPAGLRWAIAGRDRTRLERLRARTGDPALVVADSNDATSVDAMVAGTRVLLSTAGPFARYGDPVVDACVRHGVDYVDITGETAWVRQLIERHHAAAVAGRTRIVPFCGIDSVPSDLGTLLVARWLREQWEKDTRRVSASFVWRSGLNGGTLATLLNTAESGQLDATRDVLLLNPPGEASEAERARSAELAAPRFDPDRGVWLAPFPMAPVNTRVVRRSAALLRQYGEGYGPEFTYEEALEVRSRPAARAAAVGQELLEQVVSRKVGRWLIRRIGPKPGHGPSPRMLERGYVKVRLLGEAADGRKAMATIQDRGDPGNRITVKIVCEAALALATQRGSLPGGPERGGILTPATGLGLPLLSRLEAAGMRVEVGAFEPSRTVGAGASTARAASVQP